MPFLIDLRASKKKKEDRQMTEIGLRDFNESDKALA